MSSLTYASYLSGHADNPYHINHINEFVELATMIAKEQIESYMPVIESMVSSAVGSAMNNALAQAKNATSIDVNRIVNVTCKGLNEQFHSEELTHWVADTLKVSLEDAFRNMDIKLIV